MVPDTMMPDTMTDNLTAVVSAANGQAAVTAAPSPVAAQDSCLANLPVELLNRVAHFLPTPAFNSMRLTCKLVENKLFEYWANSFFKQKQFMISAFSLQALVDISCHENLAPRLSHLVIGLDHLQAQLDFYHNLDTNSRMQCQQARDSQEDLLDSGVALELLSEALPKFTNLNTVDFRNFNSRSRHRDDGCWKSYGYSEIPHWAIYLDHFVLSGAGPVASQFMRRVFKVVLTSLGRSKNPIRSLEVLLRSATKLGVQDVAFFLSPGLHQIRNTFPSLLSGLTKLHLDLDLFSNIEGIQIPTSADQFYDPHTMNLRKFLALTCNITWLRLNFNSAMIGRASVTASTNLLIWLALDPEELSGWSDTNPKPISPPLLRLDLRNCGLAPRTLRQVFKKFQMLETCCFREIELQNRLSEDSSDGEEENDYNSERPANSWACTFRTIPFLAPKLKRLSLSHLRLNDPDSLTEQVVFLSGVGGAVLHSRELAIVDASSLEALANETWGHAEVFERFRSSNSEDMLDDSSEDLDDSDDSEEQEEDGDGEDGDDEVDMDG